MDVWIGLLAWVIADRRLRHVSAQRHLERRPAVAEHVVRRADARIEVLPQGTFFTSAKLRAGTHPFGVAATLWAGTYPLKYS